MRGVIWTLHFLSIKVQNSYLIYFNTMQFYRSCMEFNWLWKKKYIVLYVSL